jgi:D-methionine transport system permease protein
MNNLAATPLIIATWQTIYMVCAASFFSICFGLCCGVGLFVSNQGQILENKIFNRIFGLIVNTARSIPFIILLISIIPLTRLIVGTSIGTNAAIVPLTIAAIPFFARVVESALKELSASLVETAHAMGATNWQIIYKVLLPEALPNIVRGATLTIIGLIGYSAMAGAVGGGGLGELAINYGYQQFNLVVMLETVLILVVIVQLVQSLGDYLAKKRKKKFVLIAGSFLLSVFVANYVFLAINHSQDTLKVGIVSGPQQEVMQVAKEVANKEFGLKIKLVIFDDYVLPNTALEDGSIDANIFQHLPYLNAQNKAWGYHLVSIGKTYVYPMGFYSRKIGNISQLKNHAIVAIPNDPSNEGRALLILQAAKYIKLKSDAGLFATPKDIINNPYNLQFKLLDAAQLPRVFKDVDLVGLNNDYLKPAGFIPSQALIKEDSDSPYANIIVVRERDKNNPQFKKLVAVMQSQPVEQVTEKLFPDSGAIPAWKK